MDHEIEYLLKRFNEIDNLKPNGIYDEINKFRFVDGSTIKNQIINISQDPVIVERIIPENGKIVYIDSYGRKTISMESLGYQLVKYRGTETYIPNSLNKNLLDTLEY